MNQAKTRACIAALVGMTATTAASVLVVGGFPAQAQQGRGKVAPWDAMKAAVGKAPGKALSATYTNEGGKWIYDVIVIQGKKITEVEVDATTGKAGSTEVVTPQEEAKEMAEELNKAIGMSGKAGKAAPESEADEKNEKSEAAPTGAPL